MGTHPIFESDFDCLTEFLKMPKSRRDRTIALTRTSKKQGIEHKEKIIEQVRTLCDTYERCFVYSLDNTRNNHLKLKIISINIIVLLLPAQTISRVLQF